MRGDEAGLVDTVVVAILDHLRRHPLAADSADGVARWWLGPLHASALPAHVEQALELLVARRTLRRLTLMDGTVLYAQAPPDRQ